MPSLRTSHYSPNSLGIALHPSAHAHFRLPPSQRGLPGQPCSSDTCALQTWTQSVAGNLNPALLTVAVNLPPRVEPKFPGKHGVFVCLLGGGGIYLFVLVVLKFKLKVLYLLGRCSTTWAMLPVLCALVFCFILFSLVLFYFALLCFLWY
jgi:hypothetical protein